MQKVKLSDFLFQEKMMRFLRQTCLALATFLVTIPTSHANSFVSQSQTYSPPNDDFANAFYIGSTAYATLGNISYATRELGELKYASTSIGRSVWYKYTATSSGRAVVLLTTANMAKAPLQMQAFTGSKVSALTKLAKAQVPGTTDAYSASMAFNTVKGTVYYIQVDSAPQSSTIAGDFLLSVNQYGSAGGMGALVYKPNLIQDDSYSSDYKVLIGNGYKTTVDVQAGVSTIGGDVALSPAGLTLAVGKTNWFTASDNSSKTVQSPASGKLVFTALAQGTYVGSTQLSVTIIPRDYNYHPTLMVRFKYPGQGVPYSRPFSSPVVITNTSSYAAQYCRFVPDDYVYNLRWNEVLSNGTLGTTNGIFSISGNTTKKFNVSAVSSSDYSREVNVSCSNSYASINSDDLSSLWGYNQRGMYSSVRIDFLGANALNQIKIPDYNTKKIVVAIKNTGSYSGYFNIDPSSTQYNVVVDSICISNSSGSCIGTANDDSVDLDLANGETAYVALSVGRRNATDLGMIYVRVTSIDSPGTRNAGYGGFEVIE